MFIYKLTNTLNNKIYIGLTTESISERCRKRIAEAKYRDSRNSYILNAIRKHGSEVFKVEQIDTANSLKELQQKEIFYIQQYNSTDRKIGYNLTKGGEGNLGLKMSDETKEKIRQKRLGNKWSEERKIKHSETLKSKNIDYSKAKENCKLYNLKTSKKVGEFDLDHVLINTYDSISDARRVLKISRSTLDRRLKLSKKGIYVSLNNKIYKLINQIN
jgi:group I intron endonuclease